MYRIRNATFNGIKIFPSLGKFPTLCNQHAEAIVAKVKTMRHLPTNVLWQTRVCFNRGTCKLGWKSQVQNSVASSNLAVEISSSETQVGATCKRHVASSSFSYLVLFQYYHRLVYSNSSTFWRYWRPNYGMENAYIQNQHQLPLWAIGPSIQ